MTLHLLMIECPSGSKICERDIEKEAPDPNSGHAPQGDQNFFPADTTTDTHKEASGISSRLWNTCHKSQAARANVQYRPGTAIKKADK